jgi:uncharacterized membrane protein required for colicin V production
MVFWISILVGALFAWLAVKSGFYESWAMLFNIVISVYLAVVCTPVIIEIIPASKDTPYGNALCLIAAGIGCFMVLHGISYTCLTGQFKMIFPKAFDIVLAGMLGFLSGFLVLSFAVLVFTAMPISQNQFLTELGLSKESQQANISYVAWWCDKVNSFVVTQGNNDAPQQAIKSLLDSATKPQPGSNKLPALEPNTPADANRAPQHTGSQHVTVPASTDKAAGSDSDIDTTVRRGVRGRKLE